MALFSLVALIFFYETTKFNKLLLMKENDGLQNKVPVILTKRHHYLSGILNILKLEVILTHPLGNISLFMNMT